MSVPVNRSWYPSYCMDLDCTQKHRILEGGLAFHPGVYVYIKGFDRQSICNTKLRETREITPIPREKFYHAIPGILDIRTLVVLSDLTPRFYDFLTSAYPNLYQHFKTNENIRLENSSVGGETESLLRAADELEDISHGL